jgi:hypothetical protein
MRPRLISIPMLDPNGSPYERFKQFARVITSAPKAEVNLATDRKIQASRTRKSKGTLDQA